MPTRDDIVDIARSWIGTPYHHQASLKGIGCDCLGFVRGVWRELYGFDAELPPPYSPDWAEAMGRETMLEAAGRHLSECNPRDAQKGDVLIFRFNARSMAKHAAILTSDNTMVHAIENNPAAEVHLGQWWRRHIAGAFYFPGIE